MATQQEIAEHFGLNQSAISDALNALGLQQRDWQAMSLDKARLLLVRHYSEIAARRGGSEQYKLASTRARESQLKGDLLQLQIQEKAGALVQAAAVEQEWLALVTAARTELLMLADRLAHEIKALHGIDIDRALIENRIQEALTRLADTEPEGEDA